MSILSKKSTFLLALAVALYAFILNEYNNKVIRKLYPKNDSIHNNELVHNSTVYNIDNYWYTQQIKNYVKGNGFTIDPQKEKYEVRRTPIYPLFYGVHYLLFGEIGSYYLIRFTQIALFVLSVFALLYATYNFTQNKFIAITSAIFYGFNPSIVCYLYYTITEALSPALVCFMLYYLSKGYRQNRRQDWIVSGLFFAIASLCRPAIFFIAPGILVLIIYTNKHSIKRIIFQGSFFVFGAAILFVPHMIRNYQITNDIIVLEKFYEDPMDYGMPNIALREWISCWTNPADYSSESISNRIGSTVLSANKISFDKEMFIENEINRLPQQAFIANSKDNVQAAFSTLYDYYYYKRKLLNTTLADSVGKISLNQLHALKNEFIQKEPVRYYILKPILFFKSILFQSNSSQLIFLKQYPNTWIEKAIKGPLYLWNIYLFISILGMFLFYKKHFALQSLTILYLSGLIVYTVFMFNYFEVRYLIPIFPLMYVMGTIFFVEMYGKIKRVYTSK